MILISYDIKCDKLRRQFSKYLKKYGYMLQYSVYEITHSENMLDKIKLTIQGLFENRFSDSDSVIIIQTTKTTKIDKYGYAKHDNDDIILID